MSLPTTSNPLDPIVYASSLTFMPSKKQPSLAFKGKEPKGVKWTLPPIKIKRKRVMFDVLKDRQNRRTRLLNRKATLLERSMNDMIEQNEAERRYAEQQAQLRRLENLFANSLLAGVVEGVVTNAKDQLLSQYFKQDPDINNFDRETEKVMKDAERLQKLQKDNEEAFQRLRQSRTEMEQAIQRSIEEAGDDLAIAELEMSINELDAIPEVSYDEGEAEAPQAEEIDDDDINKELAYEEEKAQEIDETQKKISEMAEKRVGKPFTAKMEETAELTENLLGELEGVAQFLLDSRGATALSKTIQRKAEKVFDEEWRTKQRETPRPANLRKLLDELNQVATADTISRPSTGKRKKLKIVEPTEETASVAPPASVKSFAEATPSVRSMGMDTMISEALTALQPTDEFQTPLKK